MINHLRGFVPIIAALTSRKYYDAKSFFSIYSWFIATNHIDSKTLT